MKLNSSNRAAIAARLRNMRKAGALGALVSLSTLRALSVVEDRGSGRDSRDNKHQHAPQNVNGGGRGGYLLTPTDRAQLAIVLGRLPKSNVFASDPIAPSDDPADLLPSNFVPLPIAPYSPILIRDAEIEAQAAREAAIEIEAREMVADMFYAPIDYSPDAGRVAVAPVFVHETTPKSAPTLRRPNRSAHRAWQAAILKSIETAE